MPAFTADYYGSKNVGPIYGLMLTAWGFASAFGPLDESVAEEQPQGDAALLNGPQMEKTAASHSGLTARGVPASRAVPTASLCARRAGGVNYCLVGVPAVTAKLTASPAFTRTSSVPLMDFVPSPRSASAVTLTCASPGSPATISALIPSAEPVTASTSGLLEAQTGTPQYHPSPLINWPSRGSSLPSAAAKCDRPQKRRPACLPRRPRKMHLRSANRSSQQRTGVRETLTPRPLWSALND